MSKTILDGLKEYFEKTPREVIEKKFSEIEKKIPKNENDVTVKEYFERIGFDPEKGVLKPKLNLSKLSLKLDKQLQKETEESLKTWLYGKRNIK